MSYEQLFVYVLLGAGLLCVWDCMWMFASWILQGISATMNVKSKVLKSPRLPRRRGGGKARSGKVSPEDEDNGSEVRRPYESPDDPEDAKEWAREPRRICLFIEPSPFAHVSGYKNRFQNLIRNLVEFGDDVLVITTRPGAPPQFHGAKVVGVTSFTFPWYKAVRLSFALSPRVLWALLRFKPEVLHCTSPGVMVIGALFMSKLLRIPLLLSYHTHIPIYAPLYTWKGWVAPIWGYLRFVHNRADVTLAASQTIANELRDEGAGAPDSLFEWRRAVDSEIFHPSFKSEESREKLSGGHPEAPLIVHVGRLGVEKNLGFLRALIDRIPGARLAIVGDGPARKGLEVQFKGTPTVFTGMLHGEELSQAYASGDIFVTPSESETLGFVVLESMAAGVPSVAPRAGGIVNIVREGVTGFLYTPGDLDDFAAKVKLLVEDKDRRSKMAEAGRLEVENFDWRSSIMAVRVKYGLAVYRWRRKRAELTQFEEVDGVAKAPATQ